MNPELSDDACGHVCIADKRPYTSIYFFLNITFCVSNHCNIYIVMDVSEARDLAQYKFSLLTYLLTYLLRRYAATSVLGVNMVGL